ncbi:MAG: glycine cleavage system protein H [Clostridia bacterium]|nr:glycine cleavage system protein H [Clostridia bacterium]
MQNIENNIFYFTKTHEWVRFTDNGTAFVGVTEYLTEKKKTASFINLCDEGDYLNAGDTAGDIEYSKGIADIYSPVSGTVERVNDDVLNHPEKIGFDPYGSWLIELSEPMIRRRLLTEKEYKEYIDCEEQFDD